MANPNKFNDLSASGNVQGPLIKETSGDSNNGRTPVNPEAEGLQPSKVVTVKPTGSSKGFSPEQA